MDAQDNKRRGAGSADNSNGLDAAAALLPSSDPASAGKGMFLVIAALIVGIIGIITGIGGIYLASSSASDLAELKKQVAARPDPVALMKPTVDSIDKRLKQVGEEAVRANNGLRDTNSALQRAMQSIAADIRADREQINKLTAALDEMTRKPAPAPAPVAKKAEGDGRFGSDAPEPATDASGQRIHIIQSGDIFSKLAKQYGVSTQAIIDANPNVDPSKLQIGQKIIIPASK